MEIELAAFQFYMKCLNALGHYPKKTDVKRLQLLILFTDFIATYPTNKQTQTQENTFKGGWPRQKLAILGKNQKITKWRDSYVAAGKSENRKYRIPY